MDIAPIKTQRDYRNALKEIERLMTAKRNTPEGDRLDVLVTLVEAWEWKHYRFDLPDPVEAIKYHMDQNGLLNRATLFPSSATATGCTRSSIAGAPTMKTVDISDDLYRRAKSEATLRGRKLKDPVEERLRLVLEATAFRGSTSATRNPMPEFLGIIRAAMLTSRSP